MEHRSSALRHGAEIDLLDRAIASPPAGLLDFLQIGAGSQRLARLVNGRITQVQAARGRGDRFVEEQHLVGLAIAAAGQRQAGLDQALMLGLAVDAVLAIGRGKRIFGEPGQEQVWNLQMPRTGRGKHANPARLLVGHAQRLVADDIQQGLAGLFAVQSRRVLAEPRGQLLAFPQCLVQLLPGRLVRTVQQAPLARSVARPHSFSESGGFWRTARGVCRLLWAHAKLLGKSDQAAA